MSMRWAGGTGSIAPGTGAGRATFVACILIGTARMNMINSTSITSMSGVRFIPLSGDEFSEQAKAPAMVRLLM